MFAKYNVVSMMCSYYQCSAQGCFQNLLSGITISNSTSEQGTEAQIKNV